MNILQQLMARPVDVGLDGDRLAAIPNFFGSYVDRGKLAGVSTLIARDGRIAHFETVGMRDTARGLPLEKDTIFRIYSMTKPITSLALMMLYEEGRFQLNHEVSRYIPEFKDLRVWDGGTPESYETKPCAREMTIRDLLTHTSGLTYDFMYAHPVDSMYREAGIGGARTKGLTLKTMVERLAEIPLLFSPGEHWNYSVSTDVCGYLIEVLSGQSLDQFLASRIFVPLGMDDTGFSVPVEKAHRLATNYEKDPKTREVRVCDMGDETSSYVQPNSFLSGGGGLVSTQMDYFRFCQMVLNGGELDGTRLVSRKTLDLMTINNLPDGKTMKDMDNSAFSETGVDGQGFGLGFSVLLDQAAAQTTGSPGIYSWGGAASTYFWIDPAENLIAILMTQLMPSRAYPLRPQFQQLVYGAVSD